MIGYCFCGSFCTVSKSVGVLRNLAAEGNALLPIMNDSVYTTDTRFGKHDELLSKVTEICGKEPVLTIKENIILPSLLEKQKYDNNQAYSRKERREIR